MATYEFWYEESYGYKAWLEADTDEEAKKLLRQVRMGEIHIDQLPQFESNDKFYELQIDTTSLERLEK